MIISCYIGNMTITVMFPNQGNVIINFLVKETLDILGFRRDIMISVMDKVCLTF